MLRMIELHVEGFIEARREVFEWRVTGANVCVTDTAHRHLRRRELAAVTIGAGFVTWEAWRAGVVGALVTRVAGEGAVMLARVKEF